MGREGRVVSIYSPDPLRCSWCDEAFHRQADLGAHEREHRKADMEKAMGPRENPLHPMFRNHNCAYCWDGQLPCRQGAPNRCDNPRARND